jgi:hypothetical protein
LNWFFLLPEQEINIGAIISKAKIFFILQAVSAERSRRPERLP